MAVLLLERLPLPSLQAYTACSVALLGCSLYYAAQIDKCPSSQDECSHDWSTFAAYFHILRICMDEPLCLWTVINMAYCLLVLFGNWVQILVFGELRVSEMQHIKDKFWNFVFYKFIFIFGVINVEHMNQVILWGCWFSVVCFLHLHIQLCKDRFDYLCMTPGTPNWRHVRLLVLLSALLFVACALFLSSCWVGFRVGLHHFFLLAPECSILILRAVHTVLHYLMFLQGNKKLPSGAQSRSTRQWLFSSTVSATSSASLTQYYVDLSFTCLVLLLDFLHHMYMLIWARAFLSMASLVIFMQLRVLYADLLRTFTRHMNFRHVVQLLNDRCPPLFLDCQEKCAICWDELTLARLLPCGHFFHYSCLLLWMEQDPSCPTCRKVLVGREKKPESGGGATGSTSLGRFSFTQLLPSSVEINARVAAENSQVENLADEIHEMFPDISRMDIISNLRETHSGALTVENILDGRLLPATPSFHQDVFEPKIPDLTAALAENEPEISQDSQGLSYFSSSAEERQALLEERRRNMLHQARQRFSHKAQPI